MAKLILTRDNQPLKTLFLSATRIWIGTGPDCDIRIEAAVSGTRLASISRRDDRFVLASSSRDRLLQVNHRRADSHVLNNGDIIHLDDYRLLFSDPGLEDTSGVATARRRTACLKVMSGRSRGRIIRLGGPVTRFGKAGTIEVMISRRSEGYYLSHLEGSEFPRINRREIGEDPVLLSDGDTIEIAANVFEFRSTPEALHHASGDCSPGASQQRHFTRVALDIPATLGSAPALRETRLIDLSLNGALVAQPPGWAGKNGERTTLTLHPGNRAELGLPVAICQVNRARIGMAFLEMDALAREEIRGLMKPGFADGALLERELSELF